MISPLDMKVAAVCVAAVCVAAVSVAAVSVAGSVCKYKQLFKT